MRRTFPASSPPPQPVTPEPDRAWAPDEGNEFSTVLVRQVRTALVAVEHPKGETWDKGKLQKAAQRRAGDIANRACWWDADTVTEIVELHRGEYDPESDAEPLMLTEADVLPPPAIPIITT